MKRIVEILKNNPAFKQMVKGKGSILTNHTNDEALLIASAFSLSNKNYVYVAENQYHAQKLYNALKAYTSNVLYYPVDESLRIEALAYSKELLGERINTLYELSEYHSHILITHTHALTRFVPDIELFRSSIIKLSVEDVINPMDLMHQLIHIGYTSIQRVDEPFFYSKRGGIIDVYSIQYDHPIRIEFFDDEIESIRFYDENTQRSLEPVNNITILPATDLLYDNSELNEVISTIQSLHEKELIDEAYEDTLDENVSIDIESLRNEDYTPRLYQYLGLFHSSSSLMEGYLSSDLFISTDDQKLIDVFNHYKEETFFYNQELTSIGNTLKGLSLYIDLYPQLKHIALHFVDFKKDDNTVEFNTREVQLPLMNETQFLTAIKDYLTFNKVLIYLENQHQIDLMLTLFNDHLLPVHLVANDLTLYEGINMALGSCYKGIELIDEKVVILTEKELFKNTVKNKTGYIKYKDAKIIKNYTELEIGDYVVHDVNGIGQYMGIKTRLTNGQHKDYLYIAYKGNDILYIPVENFRLVRKYASRDGKPPKIHKLGGTEWQKQKAKVRKKAEDIADGLIELYAARMSQKGFAYPADDAMQSAFEQCFGYELTPDQKIAVNEIKMDMMLDKPMDRLLCGDVGFGKTEVALRAAYKAVLASKQVAFLCPTTILSSQHYHTMIERFENFAVNIAVLNRFTSTKEKNQILKDLKEGNIDILVGTHRILSKDVQFKDLGFLIIDEEQRFGVKQKEKIKEYRKTIDVLTLTATPIPRTLQMSLMGIRGLSQIDTPPLNRLPVQTYVSEKSESLIKQVIERELARDGQVFYLYNRTETIVSVANNIARIIPDAKVAVGHGQMSKDQLESVMNDFINKKYNILVCTTIIETGIDIPNANTIIVEDADRFGLAQLYQIKGRVGRSERVAYAYLLYAKNKQLNVDATKRLKAIREFTQLGSGYKIAMKDLAIRGAGDILGGEQAGFIDTVGFDMFMKILEEAINERKGVVEETTDVPVKNITVDGYIPENYVSSDIEKLNLYSRIYDANSLSKLEVIKKELNDLYGKLPREVNNIVSKREYEILCTQDFIDQVIDHKDSHTIYLTEEVSNTIPGDQLFETMNRLFTQPKIKYINRKIGIEIIEQQDWLIKTVELLYRIKDLIHS